MSFGSRLRKLRKENKLNQKELAKQFNTSKTAISNYERNYRKPDIDKVIKMADFFDVSVDYMLDRTNYRVPEWLHNKPRDERDEYLDIINQAQSKGLKPSDLETIIEIFEQIKPIVDSLTEEES